MEKITFLDFRKGKIFVLLLVLGFIVYPNITSFKNVPSSIENNRNISHDNTGDSYTLKSSDLALDLNAHINWETNDAIAQETGVCNYNSEEANYNGPDKVLLCHKEDKSYNNPRNGYHTISVAPASVKAHLDHGDTLGACGDGGDDTDADGDGVSDEDEKEDGTDPLDYCDYNPEHITFPQSDEYLQADCDGDGVSNGQEHHDGTDPLDPCDFVLEHQ
ncbi:MAG: thrombospondin type 3 repeat-containing protein, partial [Allomuricauda sp.]